MSQEVLKERLKQILAELGLQLTASQLGTIKLAHPAVREDLSTVEDRKWFARNKVTKRFLYIRHTCYGEFDGFISSDTPKLWLLVIFIDDDYIIRVPIWRGECPYQVEPKSDSAVMAIVAQCNERGGVDDNTIRAWLQKEGKL
jgi:hypothetical protein